MVNKENSLIRQITNITNLIDDIKALDLKTIIDNYIKDEDPKKKQAIKQKEVIELIDHSNIYKQAQTLIHL